MSINGTLVAQIVAVDGDDITSPISYEITAGDPGLLFRVTAAGRVEVR